MLGLPDALVRDQFDGAFDIRHCCSGARVARRKLMVGVYELYTRVLLVLMLSPSPGEDNVRIEGTIRWNGGDVETRGFVLVCAVEAGVGLLW